MAVGTFGVECSVYIGNWDLERRNCGKVEIEDGLEGGRMC